MENGRWFFLISWSFSGRAALPSKDGLFYKGYSPEKPLRHTPTMLPRQRRRTYTTLYALRDFLLGMVPPLMAS